MKRIISILLFILLAVLFIKASSMADFLLLGGGGTFKIHPREAGGGQWILLENGDSLLAETGDELLQE
jgi:hypothetical protein